LSWTASLAAIVGLANYIVQRLPGVLPATNFAQVATPAGITYNDTGSRRTRVTGIGAAVDTSGALSPVSNAAVRQTVARRSRSRYVQGNAADPQAPADYGRHPFTAAQRPGAI